jgi:hypothetical protein
MQDFTPAMSVPEMTSPCLCSLRTKLTGSRNEFGTLRSRAGQFEATLA